MKTIEVKVYRYEELSEEAQEHALEQYQQDEYSGTHWQEENLESIKKGLEHFDWKLSDWSIDYWCATNGYTKIEPHGLDDDAAELAGVRLWKYLNNNGYLKYFCQYDKKVKNLLDGNCPFTGYCGDENFLDPVRKFIERPDDRTFRELMNDCVYEGLKLIQTDYEHQMSEQFFKEECEGNDRWFTEDGNTY